MKDNGSYRVKQKTNARKWHASIKRCEMEKEVKNINDF